MKKEDAVSEIVGAILLVALVILGIGIIGVLITSTPPPVAKEKVVLSSSCIDCNGSYFVILVRHEGGDLVNPQTLNFWLRTEYPNGTPFDRLEIGGSRFYTAETFSGLTRTDICYPATGNEGIPYGDATKMSNGDVAIIEYLMKEN